MRIPDKATFNALSQRGLLGNFLRTWKDIDEAKASHAPWFTIQGTQPQSPYFVPVVADWELEERAAELIWRGARLEDIYYRAIPDPRAGRIVNLEVRRDSMPDGYLKGVPSIEDTRMHLVYSAGNNINLRHDLSANGTTVTGLRAAVTLRHYLQEDVDVLEDIWARYPDAVIEASRFTRPCGVLNRKLVVWEVRNF